MDNVLAKDSSVRLEGVLDPALPVSDVRLMRQIVERSLGGQTFNTVLLGGLAGLALLLALLLAAVGLTRFLRSLLSDISTTDPWVFVLAPTLLVTIALIATLRPACAPPASIPPARCARIDPGSVYDRSLFRGICEPEPARSCAIVSVDIRPGAVLCCASNVLFDCCRDLGSAAAMAMN